MSQYKGDTRILLIQTAFIGDAILATALLESIANAYNTKVDILVRKGNGIFFENNPNVGQLLIWDKKGSLGKYKSLFKLIKTVKQNQKTSMEKLNLLLKNFFLKKKIFLII